MATDYVLMLTTVPADGDAETLARTIVTERLAACVNLLPPMASVYRWEGAVEQAAERQLLIKTTTAGVERLQARLEALHPYEVPEILVLPISGGGQRYLQWLGAAVD